MYMYTLVSFMHSWDTWTLPRGRQPPRGAASTSLLEVAPRRGRGPKPRAAEHSAGLRAGGEHKRWGWS